MLDIKLQISSRDETLIPAGLGIISRNGLLNLEDLGRGKKKRKMGEFCYVNKKLLCIKSIKRQFFKEIIYKLSFLKFLLINFSPYKNLLTHCKKSEYDKSL